MVGSAALGSQQCGLHLRLRSCYALATVIAAAGPRADAGQRRPRLPHWLRAREGRGRGGNLGRVEPCKPGCTLGSGQRGGDREQLGRACRFHHLRVLPTRGRGTWVNNGLPSSRGAPSSGRCPARLRSGCQPGTARREGAVKGPSVASQPQVPAPLEISLSPVLQVRLRRHGSEGLSESLCRL